MSGPDSGVRQFCIQPDTPVFVAKAAGHQDVALILLREPDEMKEALPPRRAGQIPAYLPTSSTSVARCSLPTPSANMTSLSELSVRRATICW